METIKNWHSQITNLLLSKKQTGVILNILFTLIILSVCSCTSQMATTSKASAEKINYKDAYFDLMEQNKKYVFENEQLKYENSKLFFNNYAEYFASTADIQSEDPDFLYSNVYMQRLNDYQKKKIDKIVDLKTRLLSAFNLDEEQVVVNNDRLSILIDNDVLFFDEGVFVNNDYNSFFTFISSELKVDSDLELLIVNHIDAHEKVNSIYFKDALDLAFHKNNEIRRKLVDNSILPTRIVSTINDCSVSKKTNLINKTELVFKYKNNFYNSTLSSIK
ncbi:hypothetical protein [Chondrinema litorale]|uniref:hypothetical protein n=1 Tax=Chondrinema litorale TaxID=2994555 RepID=UPI002543DDA0|nr:hypothetical protein [Chondrinema litorale]UZR98874.1 hypothetical protein OQ292_33325 [Chondrinema litorale]